ncbi:hypothetical protein N665_0112s0004 [Sinapis alba]|nr:hypothetical protein N665_0112s0004 [Sinapis alba]
MMSSMALHSSLSSASLCSSFISQHPKLSMTASSPSFHNQSTKPISLNSKIVALLSPETLTTETVTDVSQTLVVVFSMFLDMEQSHLVHTSSGQEKSLSSTLEAKPWISQKKMIILLNQATDIINLWQQSGGNLTSQ